MLEDIHVSSRHWCTINFPWNNKVFTYTSFDNDSQVAKSIAEALSTTINVPCIFSIAYWKEKSNAKRKR